MNQSISSVQEEKMLLGAVISGGSPSNLLTGLVEDDFVVPDHKTIFREIRRCINEKSPIDPTTIASTSGGVDAKYLVDLCAALAKEGNPWNAKQYAEHLHELGNKRRLCGLFDSCSAGLIEGRSMQEIMDKCRQGMRDLSSITGKVIRMPDAIGRYFDRIDALVKGDIVPIKTGLAGLDDIIWGLSPGELDIIGARPSVGKSAFSLGVALRVARNGKRVMFCSLEMNEFQFMKRIISEISGINSMAQVSPTLSDRQYVAIGEACNEASKLGISFTFNETHAEDIYSICAREKDEKGLDLLVFDYMQIANTREKAENETIRLSLISSKLKRLAVDLDIPVLALAQVKRQEGTSNRMPTLSELRGSGSMEQDADKVIFLHRIEREEDEYCKFHEETLRRFKREGRGEQLIVANVAKNRDGAIGHIHMRFEPGKMRYHCLTQSAQSTNAPTEGR